MCEPNVYLISKGTEKEVMREAARLEVNGDSVLFSDLLGNEKQLRARIRSIDFVNDKVILEEI